MKSLFRPILAISTFIITLPLNAFAQDQLEEIVVMGVRSENRQIIEQKAAARGISDFLSADDVGRLPDFNLADAIRRAPGVNTIFDEDEGQFVALRGLNADFVHTTFDGGSVATADLGSFFGQGRRVLLESIPAGAVQNIAIHKTRTAQTDGQALGGAVNLRTRSAFDVDGQHLVATGVFGNYSDQDVPTADEEPSWRSDVTWSNTFADNRFGVVVSGFWNRKKRDQQRLLPNIVNAFYSATDGSVSDGSDPTDLPFGRVVVEAGYTNSVDRYGGVAKLEFKPSDDFYSSLSAIIFRQDEDEQRNQLSLLRFCGPACEPTGVNGAGLVFGGVDNGAGGLNTVPANLRVDHWGHRKGLVHLTYHLDFDINDNNRISANTVYSEAKYDIVDRTVITFSSIPFGTFLTDHTPGSIGIIIDDPSLTDDASDFANTVAGKPQEFIEEDNAELIEFSLDYEFNSGENFGYVAGVTYREIQRDWDTDQIDYQIIAGATPTFADFANDGPSYTVPGGTFMYPSVNLNLIDFDSIRNGISPFYEFASFNERPGNEIHVDEAVFGAYAGFTYQRDRWYVDGGLRYEQTKVDSLPFDNDLGEFQNRSGEYSNVLPSLNVVYDVSDNVKIKGGISQSLGRPSHAQLTASIATNVDATSGVVTVSEGNANIEPRVSTNFDLGVDYFFNDGDGILSVAVFYKDIKDEIFTRTTQVDPLLVTIRPENAEDAKVSGFEVLFIMNKLEFLPGPLRDLGFSANYSAFDGEIQIDAATTLNRLLEQPDYIVNASLFYQSDRFEARLSYNEIDGNYKLGQSFTSPSGEFDDTREFLDAQVRFNVNENWQIFAEGRNLDNEPEQTRFIQFPQYISDSSTFGTSYWIGVTYSQ